MFNDQFPLSPVQKRLWFLRQLGTHRDEAVSVAYKFRGRANRELLQERLDCLVKYHDALRIAFKASDEEDVAQLIVPSLENYGLHVVEFEVDNDDAKSAVVYEQMVSARSSVSDVNATTFFRADLLLFTGTENVLLLTAHRLVCDLASLDYIATSLLNISQDLVRPVKDFKTLLTESANVLDANLARWSQSLIDSTFVCELPQDRIRPPVQRESIANYHSEFSADSLSRIKYLAEYFDVSYGIVLMTVYLCLIYRYTMQDDILLGLAYRLNESFIAPVGPFTDIAVMRQQFSIDITFVEMLTSLNKTYSDTLNNQPPPFPLLIDALSPVRDLSRAPVVQHGFAYKDLASIPFGVEVVYESAELHQMDLMLQVRQKAENLVAIWHYDEALFNNETVHRMHSHLEMLLRSAAEQPNKPVRQLSLITPEEKELLNVGWNNTGRQVDDHDFVYRLFEKQVVRTPDAIAAREPGKEITYSALNERANLMADFLVNQGVGSDNIVSILADRNIDYLAAILSINKAGGAFLPLSPAYPARRLAVIFERSDTSLVLVSGSYLEVVQEAVTYMPMERRPSIKLISKVLDEGRSKDNLPARCEMHHLAYVMFTSGSTGEPKGVMVHHAGNINHIYAKITDLGLGKSDILAQTSRQSFDIVVWQFLAPLVVGGSIYILPDDVALDPSHLLLATEKYGVTILQLVPVNIEALLDVADAMGDNRPMLKSLRWMVPTGDALPTDLCRRWLGLYPHVQMLNTYGATECSDDQCHHVIVTPPSADYRLSVMTIGRPILNTQVYILDDALQPVPIGVVGELYIAGVGVGRGYLKDKERTAHIFIPNPFSDDTNSKLYRSGDQSRYLPDGTIEFIGRIGHMIKIRGMRIEPGEIQSVLSRHPHVVQATLIVHEFPGIGAQLIAYIVYRRGEVVAESDLRAYLHQYLPDYMIPSYFVAIDAMPLNANGKIDRKALLIPDFSNEISLIVDPRTHMESMLLDIWRKVLKRNGLSIHDNFFDVGGHSLLAMQLFSEIERLFHCRLPLKTIFQASTIATQAELLSNSSATNDSDDKLSGLSCVVTIQKGDPKRPPFFCVHAGGGHVIFFQGLARNLGQDQTFFGIQALGIDGNHEPLNRFEELAAFYVREIRVVQPEGPYYIGGECMGGTIAFEVARQLEEQGQSVGLLVMFDSFCAGIPTLKPGVPMWLYEIMFNIRRSRIAYLSKLRGMPVREKIQNIADIFQRVVLTIRRIFFSRILVDKNTDPLKITQAALNEAEHAYLPNVINATVTLFNSELPWGLTEDETLGWQGHSKSGVDIYRIPTLFDMMIEGPDVKLAATRLREILDRKFSKVN